MHAALGDVYPRQSSSPTSEDKSKGPLNLNFIVLFNLILVLLLRDFLHQTLHEPDREVAIRALQVFGIPFVEGVQGAESAEIREQTAPCRALAQYNRSRGRQFGIMVA